MTQKVDVLVVGCGAIGVCTALYLQQRGFQVLMLDRNTVGGACSAENAGLIVPSHVVPLAAPGVITQGLRWMFAPGSPFRIKPRLDLSLAAWLWQFRKACHPERMHRSMPVLRDLLDAGRSLYEDLQKLDGLYFSLQRRGLLILYRGETGRNHCEQEASLAAEMGLDVQLLDSGALFNLEPAVPVASQGAVYYPGDAHFDPRQFVLASAAYLRAKGVIIRSHTDVSKLVLKDRKIVEVDTSAGSFAPRYVVLANGTWSPLLARDLGVKLLVQAGKGYSVTLPTKGRLPRIPMILSEARATVTPLSDHLRFAGTLELAGLDPAVDRRRLKGVLEAATEYIPNFSPEQVPNDRVWVGFRPCSPDGLPYIGRATGCDNLVVATGHAMLGMSLAPITGLLTAQIIADEPSSLPLTPFALDRF